MCTRAVCFDAITESHRLSVEPSDSFISHLKEPDLKKK
jgi:hypothetical protein